MYTINSIKRSVRAGAMFAVVGGIVVATALPSAAAISQINCQGFVETINSGQYFSQTQNRNLKCGAVANTAKINIYGQLLWASTPAKVSGKTNYYREYAGVVQVSRHYHNNTYADLQANY